MEKSHIRFLIGQPIHHKLFNYRGVIVECDSVFSQSDAWYQTMTQTNPPKDAPWYYILVHGSPCMAYVAEKNLEPDLTGRPIENPALAEFFDNLDHGLYKRKQQVRYEP